MPRGNGEGVGRGIDGGPQANDTTIPKVVRVEHRRVVHLVVGDAFDVPRTAEGRVDRYGVATRRAARVGEGPCFVVVRSRETTAWARLAGAGAWLAIPANTIRLSRITCRELAGGNGLIRTTCAGRDREWDRLRSTRVSEVK